MNLLRFTFVLLLWLMFASCGAPVPAGNLPTSTEPVVPDPALTPASQSLGAAAGWERSNTAIYHLWVASFADSNGDGTGDLNGLTAKVNAGYFASLGVNTLWLSPIFKATTLTTGSGNKHGYDTLDYDTVAPLFGTRDDLAHLLLAAHAKGLRVLFDFVPNHTSNQSPWFTTHKDWYVWRTTKPSGWTAFASGGPWWGAGPYYYGLFSNSMPDLDYRNTEVVTEMRNVVTRWLNFGFDGLRIDAVKYLVEGPNGDFKDQPETHTFFDNLRSLLDSYTSQGYAKFMMAENWDGDLNNVRSYLNNGGVPEFHVALDFIWPYTLRDNLTSGGASALLSHLVDDNASLPAGSAFGVFQSNHDNVVDRPATLWAGQPEKAQLAAALSILGRGTPIVYYGNEIGMTGAAGNDLNLRQAFNWSSEVAQALASDSLWTWHSQLLHLRTALGAYTDPAIQGVTVSSAADIVAFLLTGCTGARALVVANLGNLASPLLTVPGGFVSVTTVFGTDDKVAGAGTLTVRNLPPYALRVYALDTPGALVERATDGPLYLRGSMTTKPWDDSQLLADDGTGTLSRSFVAPAGGWVTFKFGSQGWTTAWPFASATYDASTPVPAGSTLAASASVVSDGTSDDNFQLATTPGVTYTVVFRPANLTFRVLTSP
ncbi:MAG: alpha-amylase family glycosyl hydrolase [Spirochaetales bacterium]